MLDKFLLYINGKKLLDSHDRVLLAVSGGKDSMAMLHLFEQSPWTIAVGHINHGLRGEEARKDAHLVETVCRKANIPFHMLEVPQGSFDAGNMQSMARDIRYSWLKSMAEMHGYTRIATAHHATDAVETTFINLLRGTGLAGMDGIACSIGLVIRPMLCFTAADIATYVSTFNIPYREDASNASDTYLRNRIRHHLLPVLDGLSPKAQQQIFATSKHLAEAKMALDQLARDFWSQATFETQGITTIQLHPYRTHSAGAFLLWWALQGYGFNREQTDDMLASSHIAGAEWHSSSHLAYIVGEAVELCKKEYTRPSYASDWFTPPVGLQTETLQVSLDWVDVPANPVGNNKTMYLDGDAFTLPLRLRNWRAGDHFSPLGMRGQRQKVQDFLTNNKVSKRQKQEILVLESQEGIVCIPGFRMAEWVRITAETKRALRITCDGLSLPMQATP